MASCPTLKPLLPEFVYQVAGFASKAMIVLMLTELGLFFEFRLKRFRLMAEAILQRCLNGFLIRFIVTWALEVEGLIYVTINTSRHHLIFYNLKYANLLLCKKIIAILLVQINGYVILHITN